MFTLRSFTFIGFAWACTAWAQQAEVTRYDVDQGLPQSMVNHVLQDADGFIWLGTGDGLARFDGTRFVVYKHDPKDSTSLSNNSIWGLGEVDKQHLWVGTRTGLDKLDRRTGRFTHYHFGTPGADGCWRPMDMRMSTSYLYSPLTASFLRIDERGAEVLPTQHEPSYVLHTLPTGSILSFVMPDTLITYTNGTKHGYERLPIQKNEKVSDVLPVSDQLLVLSNTDAWLWSPKSGRTELPTSTRAWIQRSSGLKHAGLDTEGFCWVAVNDLGVVKLRRDWSIEQIYPLLPAEERPLSFTGIAFDHQGNVWVPTDGKGVFKIAPQAIKFGRIMPGISAEAEPRSFFVRRITQWDSTRVLIAFYQGGFALFDERDDRLSLLPLEGVPNDADIRHLITGSDGSVWMVAEAELLAFHPTELKPSVRLPIAGAPTLMLDKEGHLLLLSSAGLQRWNTATAQLEPAGYPALHAYIDSAVNVPSALIDDHARIWTSSMNMPLEVWSPTGRVSLAAKDHSAFDGVRITAVQPSGHGTYWITSNAGLMEWDAEKLTLLRSFSIHDGLPDQYLYGMLPTGDGTWWISSNNGLTHFDPKNGSFQNYGRSDGAQSKEFNLRALFSSRSQRFYFGGVNGVNHFRPLLMPKDGDRAMVRVVGIKHDGAALDASTNTIALSYPRNRLELELAVLEFTAPEKNRYRYRIPGYIDEWRTNTPGTPLVLERVPAGDYVLEVQGLNGDGVAAPVQRLISMHVPLPFWASRWAFVLAGVLLASLIALVIFLAYRRRMRIRERIAEQEMKELRVRTRLAKDIHDDVGSGLARIAALTRTASAANGTEERLEKVSTISTELLANLRDVVWMNDPRHDDLGAVLLRIKDHAYDLFEPAGVDVRAEFPQPLPQRAIDGSFRHHFFLIAKEALHNAYKYAQAKHLLVRFDLQGDTFTLEVNDDGRGLPADSSRTSAMRDAGGNGLRNMRQRAEAMGAELSITSSANGGVAVLLTGSLPVLHEQRTSDFRVPPRRDQRSPR